jgi:hypothetical protein
VPGRFSKNRSIKKHAASVRIRLRHENRADWLTDIIRAVSEDHRNAT